MRTCSSPGLSTPGGLGLLPSILLLLLLLLLAPTGSSGGDLDKVCGKPQFSGKIMGGQSAPEGKWPWQVSLWYRELFMCGGSLIDSQWVLTAAHCFHKSTNPSMYTIFVGYHKLREGNSHSLQVSVRKIFRHPNFTRNHPYGSDVALLELRSSVDFSPHILPICLPTPGLYYEGRSSCWMTGWGILTETELQAARFLREAEVTLVDNQICSLFYDLPMSDGMRYDLEKGMLCAGDILNQKGICLGDSGGPLACEFSETWIQVGIASWGMPCVAPISPSVFSRVSYYLDWIEDIKKMAYKLSPTKASDAKIIVEGSKISQSTSYASAFQTSVLPVLVFQGLLLAP